jgi:hypothetical protein
MAYSFLCPSVRQSAFQQGVGRIIGQQFLEHQTNGYKSRIYAPQI